MVTASAPSVGLVYRHTVSALTTGQCRHYIRRARRGNRNLDGQKAARSGHFHLLVSREDMNALSGSGEGDLGLILLVDAAMNPPSHFQLILMYLVIRAASERSAQ